MKCKGGEKIICIFEVQKSRERNVYIHIITKVEQQIHYISPEAYARRFRSIYLRGFPITPQQDLLKWCQRHSPANIDGVYRGDPAEVLCIRFSTEDIMWVFVRSHLGNKRQPSSFNETSKHLFFSGLVLTIRFRVKILFKVELKKLSVRATELLPNTCRLFSLGETLNPDFFRNYVHCVVKVRDTIGACELVGEWSLTKLLILLLRFAVGPSRVEDKFRILYGVSSVTVLLFGAVAIVLVKLFILDPGILRIINVLLSRRALYSNDLLVSYTCFLHFNMDWSSGALMTCHALPSLSFERVHGSDQLINLIAKSCRLLMSWDESVKGFHLFKVY